ncbi:hypothetical protein KEM55_005442 [Ascosphaera atra]|nr:hypothetical protein KEM55_005442 [Ascosphaera atra]
MEGVSEEQVRDALKQRGEEVKEEHEDVDKEVAKRVKDKDETQEQKKDDEVPEQEGDVAGKPLELQ